MQPRRRLPTLETLELREVPATLPPGFTESVAASGVANATAMEFSPDGKLFVAQQDGALQVWQNGARLRANFFANAPLAVDFFGERGLLGIAFDPNFAANRFVYVYYTTTAADDHNRVSRFTANAAGDLALAGSEQIIWEGDPHPAGNHNGGAINFGPDGKLFIATGDNANAGNPGPTHFSQSLTSLHGKILRINSNGTIPADNPFVSQTNGRFEAIWALGLRNPFTFSFQQGTGRLFVNDVGQNTWEEINVGVPGANYGWPGVEGPTGTPPAAPGTYRAPVYAYDHGGAEPNGAAITGGAFYNPTTNTFGAAYLGDYFFSDFGGGWIYRLDFNPATGLYATSPTLFASNISAPVDLKTDNAGNLYYLSIGEQRVMRISPSQAAPTITQQPQSRTVSLGSPVTFTVAASGPGLNYQWQRADSATPNAFANIPGAVNASLGIGATQLNDNGDRFRVIVANAGGSVVSAVATLTVVNNSAPAVNIGVASGLRNGRFDAGVPITFLGAGNDPEDGALGGAAMRWRVDYLTTTASGDLDGDGLPGLTRPFVPEFGNVTGGAFTPATTGPYTLADVAYVIRLSVTDSAGLTTDRVAVLAPNTATVTLMSNPSGLSLTRDGQPVVGPNVFTGVVGFERVLGAPLAQSAGVVGYQFVNWSDGGAATHTIATPATNTTFTAGYRAVSVSGPIRYEAEHIGLNRYVVEGNASASGGRLVRAVGGAGVATGIFQGPTGRYLVQVAHYDENDGGGAMALNLGGARVATWPLNLNRGSPNPDARTRVVRNLGMRWIAQGTVFEVTGVPAGGDLARFDLIIFSRVQDDLVRAVNAGGGDRGVFAADDDFQGGGAAAVAAAITTAGVANATTPALYQDWRGGEAFRYTLDGRTPGARYRVRLHFSENVVTSAGVHVFDVAINGVGALADFDVFAAAGGRFRAVTRDFTATADSLGRLVLDFRADAGRARVSAIEVFAEPEEGRGSVTTVL